MPDQFCRDYSWNVTLRILLLFILWLWYGLTPYLFPLSSLWLITAAMLVYAGALWRRGELPMSLLMFLAALLNTLLIPYWSKLLNLLLSLGVTAILFWDVVTAEQRFEA